MTVHVAALETLARWCVLALLLLQPLWHGWLHPPQRLPVWLVLSVALLPLLLPAIAVARRRPGALFLCGLVGLLYFCHGVAEAWSNPDERVPALLEVALSLLLVGAIALAGRQRRRAAAASDAADGRAQPGPSPGL